LISDRSGQLFGHPRRHPRRRPRRLAPIDAGRHTDQLGEATAEAAQRRAADRETDLGDTAVATTQQRHRPFDAPGHQIGRGRLGVLAVDAVADPTQPRQVAQVLGCGRSAGHLHTLLPRSSGHPAASASSAHEGAAATSSETTLSSSSHPSKRSGSLPSVAAVPASGWLPSIQRRISTAAASRVRLDRARRLLLVADPSSAGWAFNPGAPVFRPGGRWPGAAFQAIGARGSLR
jgi:hypothetical protein